MVVVTLLALAGTLIGVYAITYLLSLAPPNGARGSGVIAAGGAAVAYALVLFGLLAGGRHFRRTS